MSRRLSPTFTDYVVIAISPGLIMALVGSLVFFLIEVFYQGEYDQRLNFIMALFVMAAVLIARIAIEQGRDYALLFAIPLGLVTALATFRFVEFRGPLEGFSALINIGLIGLIWWCANKLTWDSTVINEAEDASGEGLLQTVGLEGDHASTSGSANGQDLEGTTDRHQETPTFWQRMVSRRHRPHAPGVWVIYFSLAALPIFGFGNWFVPSSDLESRRYVFKLLVVYVAAALGLLLTTSFLGLRRYLRQRRVEMPMEMAATWMGTGALMIVVLLLVSAFLPRRNSEYAISDLPIFAGSPSDLWTTEWAAGNEGQLDPEVADRTDPDQSGDEKSDGPPSGDGKGKGDGDGKSDGGDTKGGDTKGGDTKGGDAKGGDTKGGDTKGGDTKRGGDQSPNGQGQGEGNAPQQPGGSQDKPGSDKGGDTKRKQPQNRKGNRGDQEKGDQPNQNNPSDDSREQDPKAGENPANPDQTGQKKKENDSGNRQGNKSRVTRRFNPTKIGSAIGGTFGQLLRFLYWVIVIAVVGFLVWRYHQQIADALRKFLASISDFWNSLLGRGKSSTAAQEQVVDPGPPPRPFSAYADPFLTGMAQKHPPAEVVRYTFEAVQAWGRERGVARHPEQTPHEYAQAVGEQESTLSRDVTVLADLYCRCAYGRDAASRSNIESLRQLWERLRTSGA